MNIEQACTYLQNYMSTFAGEVEANKITPEDVVVSYVEDKFKDPYKIKSYKQYKYQIPQLSEQKVREMKLKML